MLLIKNGYIKTMVGEDIPSGCILIDDDGKISAVGADIPQPGECEIIDAEGRLVTPGLIDAHSHIGIQESAVRWEGNDISDRLDFITPNQRGIDGINPFDEAFDEALKFGVTSAAVGPGSAKLIAGTFAAVKLCGKRIDKMIIKDPVAMKCAFGENPKSSFGTASNPLSRMTIAAAIREFLKKAQKYYKSKGTEQEQAYDEKLEAMIPVFKKEIPLKAHAHRSDDIFTAIRMAKEFGLRMTLDHCSEGALIAKEIAEEGYPVISGPLLNSKSKPELKHKTTATPGELYNAGVQVSITTDSPVVPLQFLAMSAGVAASEGLPYDEAWRSVTVNPAEALGISDRVGSLAAGRDADIVIWQNDPLTRVGASAYMTLIDGEIVYK